MAAAENEASLAKSLAAWLAESLMAAANRRLAASQLRNSAGLAAATNQCNIRWLRWLQLIWRKYGGYGVIMRRREARNTALWLNSWHGAAG